MKKVVWFVQLVLLSTIMFLSSNVMAEVPCAPDENGKCIKFVITPGNGDDSVGGSGAAGPGVSVGGGRPSWNGTLCRAALAGLGTAVCAAVGTSCVAGTFFTVGGLAIPCTVITYSVCGSIAFGGIVGAEQLCKP
jgi:hypothetical protein